MGRRWGEDVGQGRGESKMAPKAREWMGKDNEVIEE